MKHTTMALVAGAGAAVGAAGAWGGARVAVRTGDEVGCCGRVVSWMAGAWLLEDGGALVRASLEGAAGEGWSSALVRWDADAGASVVVHDGVQDSGRTWWIAGAATVEGCACTALLMVGTARGGSYDDRRYAFAWSDGGEQPLLAHDPTTGDTIQFGVQPRMWMENDGDAVVAGRDDRGFLAIRSRCAREVSRVWRATPAPSGLQWFTAGGASPAGADGMWIDGDFRLLEERPIGLPRSAIWEWSDARRATSVQTGDAAAGVAGGVFEQLDVLASHPQGGIAVLGRMAAGAGIDQTNDEGLWAGRPGDLRLVLREGDAVAGLEGTWSASMQRYRRAVMGSDGRLVFELAMLDAQHPAGPDLGWTLGVWDGAGVRVLLREGAPGPEGEGIVGRMEWFASAAIDGAGNVYFLANLEEARGARPWAQAVYRAAPDGSVRHVVRTGQSLDTPSGPAVIDSFQFPWGFQAAGTGEPAVVNARGELLLRVDLVADGALSTALVVVDPPRPLGACRADLTGDGVVDGADLSRLLAAWGPAAAGADEADLDGTLTVSAADLALLLAAWGPCGVGDFTSVGAR